MKPIMRPSRGAVEVHNCKSVIGKSTWLVIIQELVSGYDELLYEQQHIVIRPNQLPKLKLQFGRPACLKETIWLAGKGQ
jgi:hypothetical protein